MLIFTVTLLVVSSVIIFKIYGLLTHADCRSKVCLVGKTALVTGGNSGIGYQIVLALVQRGCRVIIADKIEDENLFENIFKETKSRNVVFKHVDLASFTSVRELAENVKRDEEKLDILINNAGIGRKISAVTEDGLDIVMQVNYFSASLLTHLLVGLLKKAKGRVIFTSSLLSHVHSFSLEKLKPQSSKSINMDWQYQNSKLCLIMASDIFAEKLRSHGVTSNTYHPGIVKTMIFRNSMQFGQTIDFTLGYILLLQFLAITTGKTPEQGAQTAIHLACANEVENTTGKFFSETKSTLKPKSAYNKKLCYDVWENTEKIIKLRQDEKL